MQFSLKSWFKKTPKKIAFLDGDQPIPGMIAAHQKYLKGIETHLVRAMTGANEPIMLRSIDPSINKIYLSGYTTGKEITDKFIGAYIQKAISDGYSEITVVSSDYDFIDIFKMAVQLNPSASTVTFRIIVPNCQGRLNDLPERIVNIEVIKEPKMSPAEHEAAKKAKKDMRKQYFKSTHPTKDE